MKNETVVFENDRFWKFCRFVIESRSFLIVYDR